MRSTVFGRSTAVSIFLFTLAGIASASTVSFFGTFNADGNETLFQIQAGTATTITLQSIGYGGGGLIIPGGFATSLSLYDISGNQLAHDFVGGTAVGAGCSGGSNQDPVTHLCEDAGFSFPLVAGTYDVFLTEQGNDGPDPLSNGFLLGLGDNFVPGPFNDPGVPGGAQRTGNWAVQFNFTNNATVTQLAVPEPASTLLGFFALAGFIAFRRRNGSRP